MSKLRFISFAKAKALINEAAYSKDFLPARELVIGDKAKSELAKDGIVIGYNTECPDLDVWQMTNHNEDWWGDYLPLSKKGWEDIKGILKDEYEDKL